MSLTWELVSAGLSAVTAGLSGCVMAFAAKDIVGKIFAIFFPIMGFVSSGFEHCVANMFFIPMGITIANAAPELVATQFGMSVAEVTSFSAMVTFSPPI